MKRHHKTKPEVPVGDDTFARWPSEAAEFLRDACDDRTVGALALSLRVLHDNLVDEQFMLVALTALDAWPGVQILVRRRGSFLRSSQEFFRRYGFHMDVPFTRAMRKFDDTYDINGWQPHPSVFSTLKRKSKLDRK